MPPVRATGIGVAVTVCWLFHVASHVRRGTPHDLLWACNVAIVILALGCFSGLRRLCAIAVMWLTYGLPMWLIDLANHGDFMPSSVLTHVGGLVLGVLAVRKLGWPKGSWLLAAGASLVLIVVTRLVSDPAHNLNLAFRVYPGWEGRVGPHAVYVGILLAVSTLVFWIVERACLRFVMRTRPERPSPSR